MKRFFDLILASFLVVIFFLLFVLIAILIKIDSSGPIFHISKRIGKQKKIFNMIKFRTMKIGTPQLHSNDLTNPNNYLTNIGKILRRFSLDEMPQLYNVILGQMSLVGPRPALENQYILIKKRDELRINDLIPGITGLAQISGRDIISLDQKVKFDHIYLKKQSFIFDLIILTKTVMVVGKREGIKH